MHFSATVVAVGIKACTSNCPWHTLQAHIMNRFSWPTFHAPLTLSKFTFSLDIKYIDSWEYETLHCNCPWHTLQPRTLTWCPWLTFHAPLTLSKFYFKSRNKVHFSAALIAGSTKPCIVILLDTLNNHAPWPGALDRHFTLHRLCKNFTSSLEIKCISPHQNETLHSNHS